MSLPSFKPSQRRLLLGSAIALALFATPLSYDFDHHQWQVNQAHAKSCFIAGTRILMADGCERPIETLRIGDRVRGRHGQSNRIQAIERVALGARRLYGLNHLPPFFTAEHPFLTTRGWAAIAPAMTRTENPALAVLPLFTGMHLLGWSEGGSAGNLALAPHPVELPVTSLSWVDAPPATALFNLILDGSHSYVANGLIVHNKGGEGGGNSGSGGSNSGGGGSNSSGGGSNSSGGGNSSHSGNNSGNGGDSSHNGNNGGDDSGHGGDDRGQGEHAGGDQHAGGDRHGGGDKHAGGERHAGGRVDDNGVDAVDANGNKLRGDGSVDDNGVDGVDAVDANGNKLRGDGSVDDNGVDAVDANGNKLRGDGSVDDNGVDAVDANGNKLRGDGSVDDRLVPPPTQ
ncbi:MULTISPECIES: Hint domain-containing homing endonuclease [Aeromonas]|nr:MULTISPECIES: Hint domain-containing homing endonuclease [Aeromonas]AUZ78281.1 hint domain-containing protein [Aeromonas sp. ASNIH1]KMY37692.1 intein-containing protein [Aeromonas caviae]MDK3165730.1 Hint domain-containing homing endonuclease [Aeromonas caviae]MDX7612807.1 Hint domain-containing homing endonuclease [Aeromonas caviae]MDX7728142.1 Hint domain-containing homing endonuclease [Aeromonas caviae]